MYIVLNHTKPTCLESSVRRQLRTARVVCHHKNPVILLHEASTVKAQENDVKINFMKRIKVLNEKIIKSLRELKEKNKEIEIINK